MLQDAGGMFDRCGVVLLLCSNASAFAGIICSSLYQKTGLRRAIADGLHSFACVDI